MSAEKQGAFEVQAISFDCYGTLIDWEGGMRAALAEEGLLEQIPEPWEKFVERRMRCEAKWQAGTFRPYREILSLSLQDCLKELQVRVEEAAAQRFSRSVGRWPPFEDTVSGLRRLGSRWPLLIISNVDRASMQETVEVLGIPFAELVTAEDVRAYKPAHEHFLEARRRLGSLSDGQLHAAASVFHDLTPAAELGLQAAWINRAQEQAPAEISPRLMVGNLQELCDSLGA